MSFTRAKFKEIHVLLSYLLDSGELLPFGLDGPADSRAGFGARASAQAGASGAGDDAAGVVMFSEVGDFDVRFVHWYGKVASVEAGMLFLEDRAGILHWKIFRGEGRHQSLKSEIRKRSFKGGSKKWGCRLRGTRQTLKKGPADVLRNENLDWGLYAKGFNVWQPSWTRQEAHGSAKKYWERVICKGKM